MNTDLTCQVAYSGKEALSLIKKSVIDHHGEKCGYDIIFMDCQMPLMNGFEATRQIRQYLYKKRVRQPIISAVTGH